MIKKVTSKLLKCIIALSLSILLVVSMCAIIKMNHVALAESTALEVKDENSMNSDNIDGYNGLTIRHYPEQLHATEASVRITDENNTGFELYNLDADDPIVNIVPKDYFFTVCNVVNMGDEYGYYINTIKTANNTYLSTVLVFDITTNTDLVLPQIVL